MRSGKTTGIIIIASLLMAIVFTDTWVIFTQTRNQTRESGISQLQIISTELESMITDAEKLAMEKAIASASHLEDKEDLERFIYAQKSEIEKEHDGAFNFYMAGKDWAIIPDFDIPPDYVASERVWYTGAVKNRGKPYVSSPYQDAMTGKICYTVSVMLSDNETVLGIDYNIDTVQDFIDQMYDNTAHKAVIVTNEGIIAGCTQKTHIGMPLSVAVPEYTGIWSLSKKTEGVAQARVRSGLFYEYLFAAGSGDSWYLIVSESDFELYRDSYIQLFITVLLSLALFVIIILLYILAEKSRKKAEAAFLAKEEFLSGITGKLREPLSVILNASGKASFENPEDLYPEMGRIHSAAGRLSGMVEQIVSYSSLIRRDKSSENEHLLKNRSFNKRNRNIILAFMLLVMLTGLYANVTLTWRWGTTKMESFAEKYEFVLSEWINTQKSILDMFVSTISTDPEILKDYNSTIEFLDSIKSQFPEMSVCYMTGPELTPTVFMNTGWLPEENWQLEDRPWYRDTLSSEEGWSISKPYYDSRTGGYCITISEKVFDSKTGSFLGIFGIDFYMDKLVDILGDSYSNDGYAFLVDPSGDIINHPYGSFQMSTDSSRNIRELPYRNIRTDGTDIRLIKDYDGSNRLLLAVNNYLSGFSVYVVMDIFSIFGGIIIYSIAYFIIFVTCMILIYRILTAMIIWQEEADRQLVEASDAAIAAGKAKGQFLAQMSHEIRTPINAVLGMNEMILRESGNSEIRSYSENIHLAGKNLLSLINDILDFSRIEDGKMEIIPVRYSIAAMIMDLVISVSETAKEKGLEFRTEIDNRLPSWLLGDEIRIKQVISNILTNAVKYTEKGSVTFSVGFEELPEDKENINLLISVKDTGVGIKPEDMDRLFSEFERIDEEQHRNVEGTGLGMSITKRLLYMMGTSLQVKSEYGKGSDFYFSLRQKVVDHSPLGDYTAAFKNTVKETEHCSERFTAPGARILMVDDNEMNLLVFESLLKHTLVKIDSADSGENGLTLTREHIYDMIFLDHMMPGKDGIETLHDIRSDASGLNKDTPAICITANAISGAREQYLSQGFSDYVSKPVGAEKLEDLLLKYLPEEKIILTSPEKKVPGETDSIPEELRCLNGCSVIDLSSGIINSGNADNYMALLKLFYDSADDKVLELNSLCNEGLIGDYAVKIHSLKSSLRLIGASEAGELGQLLEDAGNRGDINFIREKHDIFIRDILAIKDILHDVSGHREKNPGLPEAAPGIMDSFYDKIIEGAAEMDCDILEAAFETLSSYSVPEEERDFVAKLRHASDNYDYDSLTELMKER